MLILFENAFVSHNDKLIWSTFSLLGIVGCENNRRIIGFSLNSAQWFFWYSAWIRKKCYEKIYVYVGSRWSEQRGDQGKDRLHVDSCQFPQAMTVFCLYFGSENDLLLLWTFRKASRAKHSLDFKGRSNVGCSHVWCTSLISFSTVLFSMHDSSKVWIHSSIFPSLLQDRAKQSPRCQKFSVL